MANYLIPYTPPVTPRPSRAPRAPRPDAYLMQVLGSCFPTYWTPAGQVQCKFVKFERLHSGEIGAVYELSYWNPVALKQDVARYLWCVGDRDGRPRELKKLWGR